MKTYGKTDIGLGRKYNQDCYLIREFGEEGLLLAVADGLGGHPGGETASSALRDALGTFTPATPSPEKELKALVRKVSEELLARSEADATLFGMGSTVTAAVIINAKAHWVHVGDSRLYHLTGNKTRQVTTDQNWAQSLVEYGDMTPAEARTSPLRNMLDECVGCPDCQPVTGVFDLSRHDCLFLCTDGVHGFLDPEKFISLLSRQASLEARMDEVMQAVLDAEGEDNTTIVGVEI